MTMRNDESVLITLPNIEQFDNKAAIRDFLLRQWIAESPQTKYRYIVETFDTDFKIYLERPGQLNKGCDFVIHAEKAYQWDNGNNRPPHHGFVLDDLTKKNAEMDETQWNKFLQAVKEIYECNPYSNTIPYTTDLPRVGISYELSLKLIRWFFIEQDITYWSGEGRHMFYKAINDL